MSNTKCKACGSKLNSKRDLYKHKKDCKWAIRRKEWKQKVEDCEDKMFYYVYINHGANEGVRKCKLGSSVEMVRWLNDDGTLSDYQQGYKTDLLFDNEKDAILKFDEIYNIYNNTFKHKPYFSHGTNEKNSISHIKDYIKIENAIESQLKNYENFDGIDFCDVNANGIQIRGHHKKIKNHTYGSQPTIKYDFSNCDEAVDDFVNMWKEIDNPVSINKELSFIAAGEKYGWD